MKAEDGYRVVSTLPDSEKFGTIRFVPLSTKFVITQNEEDGSFEVQMFTEKRGKMKTEVLVRMV